MKNLYHTLGIDPKAGHEEVSAALELNLEMSEFAQILKHEQKRAAYDQAHATLKAIGILRHRLGLDSGDSWFLENCPDFAPGRLQAKQARQAREAQSPVSPGSTAEAMHLDTRQQAEPEKSVSPSSNQSYLIIAVVVAASLAILAYVFL